MIKILFLDTSALLSFFISDQGTPTMRWLISSANKAHNATRYVINNQVINEFEEHLEQQVITGEIKQSTANNILNLFNTHYKNKKFEVVGKNASIQDTMDGMYNFMGRLSQPILITCNKSTQTTNTTQYRTINPQIQTTTEIDLLLQERKPQEKKKSSLLKPAENASFCQRLFKRTRMTFAL